MVDIYLSINNSEEVMHIPVTPPVVSITSEQGTETFETAGYSFVRIIGSRELQSISWESFFPVHDYPFRRDRTMQGQEYADRLNNWRDRRLPVRLVITASGYAVISVNMACSITLLNGEVGTDGDYNYSIQLDEIDLLNYTLNNEEELTVAQYEEIMQKLTTLENNFQQLNSPMIYNYMDENMPEFGVKTIQKLMDNGYLNGTGENELGLTFDMIRLLVIIDNWLKDVVGG